MNTFALDIWDDESSLCTFYTVKWDDAKANETDKFFDKFDALPKYEKEIQDLLTFILESIGEDHGALDVFFNRPENEVKGLPSKGEIFIEDSVYYFPHFALRLYALKISEEIVVLFNGGIKDGDTNQTSSLHLQWKEACAFAKKIILAYKDGEIIIDKNNSRILTLYNGSQEIYL